MSSQIVSSYKRELATRNIVDMSGANNIFGTLGTGAFPILSRMNFIPGDNNGHTIKLTGEGDENRAVWIGLGTKIMQFWAYVFCSPLGGVIDRLAEADTNGRIQFVDEETEVPLKVKNINKNPKLLRIKRLLKKPNPWQTWEEFDAEQVVVCKIFGYCPVFAIGPSVLDKSYTKALININPLLADPIANYDFDIFGKDGLIKEWHLNILGKQYILPASDVMIVKDGFITKQNALGLPLSKIEGMDFFVSNICAAMEADNVILKKKGPLGVFSYDPGKDMAGATPLDPDAKDQLQADLSRYGLTVGQIQYVISTMPVKWNAMSFNLRDLMTKETIRAGIDGICDRFGYPAELMSGKNATYENRNSSEKWLYNNNVIPFSVRRMTRYSEFFELEDTVLRKGFNHLPVLQEDIVKSGEAHFYESQGLMIEWQAGMITWNQWQVEQERDPVEGMDIYYPEYIKKFPQMNLNKPADVKNTPSKDPSTKK
jgi:hypothetical protein